jgi:tRNA G18 (ribose-2'-O)-methylase SpoU
MLFIVKETIIYTIYMEEIAKKVEEILVEKLGIAATEVTPDATQLSQVKTPQKWVLLMGHEGKGISNEVLSVCDEVLSIEMADGVKSFNVGVAASIIMYQLKNIISSRMR